jgi:hypothetical protein
VLRLIYKFGISRSPLLKPIRCEINKSIYIVNVCSFVCQRMSGIKIQVLIISNRCLFVCLFYGAQTRSEIAWSLSGKRSFRKLCKFGKNTASGDCLCIVNTTAVYEASLSHIFYIMHRNRKAQICVTDVLKEIRSCGR